MPLRDRLFGAGDEITGVTIGGLFLIGLQKLFGWAASNPHVHQAAGKAVKKYTRTHMVKGVMISVRASHTGRLTKADMAKGNKRVREFIQSRASDKEDLYNRILLGETLLAAEQLADSRKRTKKTTEHHPKTGKVAKTTEEFVGQTADAIQSEFIGIVGLMDDDDKIEAVFQQLHQANPIQMVGRKVSKSGKQVGASAKQAWNKGNSLSSVLAQQLGNKLDQDRRAGR